MPQSLVWVIDALAGDEKGQAHHRVVIDVAWKVLDIGAVGDVRFPRKSNIQSTGKTKVETAKGQPDIADVSAPDEGDQIG